MIKYPYVFFDWDGTLASTIEAWIIAKQEIFKEYGVDLTRHQVGETLGNLNAHAEHGINDPEFDDVLYARVQQKLKQVELYEGVHELLKYLHQAGVKMAVLTTNTKQILMADADRFDVTKYFDYILTADDTVNHKPHPEVIERAMEHFGANADQVLMVGDSSKDLGAAKSAGVDAALFHHPDLHGDFYDIAYLVKEFSPKYVVENLSELEKIIGIA